MQYQLNHIRSALDEWPNPAARDVCLKIIDFVEVNSISQLEMLSIKMLAHISGNKSIDRNLISAILILSSSSLSVIDRKFLYHADDNREYPLEDDDLKEAIDLGKIIDPSTGEEVELLERNIIIYYTVSKKIRQLKSAS